MNRIQMIGTQRSGSNLVRLVLNGIDEVFAPSSGHEYRDFAELFPHYTPFGSDELIQLSEDLLQLIRLNALPWPVGGLTGRIIADLATGSTLSHIVIAMYDAATRQIDATCWASKCLENYRYLPDLISARPDLRVLHLVRDPRDVALSFRRAPIGPKDPWIIAQDWLDDQRMIRDLQADLVSRGVDWTTVRYEDLVSEPGTQFEEMCRKLSIPWDSAALQFHSSPDAVTAANLSPLWATLATPISKNRIGGYLSPDDRQFVTRVEEIVSTEMRAFGYDPVYCDHPVAPTEDALALARTRDEQLRRATAQARPPEIEEIHTRRDRYLATLRRRLTASGQSSSKPSSAGY